jgi:hypothetical protein
MPHGNGTVPQRDARTQPKPNDTVQFNQGWITEASGNSTITNGTTSIVVTHGLSVTPTLHNVRIVGLEDPTNSTGNIWASAATASNFTVNVENDPGASNWDFGWSYTE